MNLEILKRNGDGVIHTGHNYHSVAVVPVKAAKTKK